MNNQAWTDTEQLSLTQYEQPGPGSLILNNQAWTDTEQPGLAQYEQPGLD